MRVFRNRINIIIGLSVLTLLGYWSGFGFYLRNKIVISRPSHMNVEQRDFTVIDKINIPSSKRLNNLAQVDNSVRNPDKSGHASTNVDNSANKTDKPGHASKSVSNTTINADNIRPASTNVDKRTINAVQSGPASTNVDIITTLANTLRREPITVDTTRPPSTSSQKPNKIKDSQNITLYITPSNFRKGRLGNQMFRYASLIGIARALGRTLVVVPRSELQRTFKLQHVENMEESLGWLKIRESNPFSFDRNMMKLPLQNVRVDGFLQSTAYFKDAEDEVRQAFIFHEYIANLAASILRNVRTKYGPSLIIGVHARRGDFLRYAYRGYAVPETSYFLKAFEWMRSNFSDVNVTFLIASDDLGWCNNNLVGERVTVMPPASSSVHLAVLSRCDHVIISGGSFGWWGGWLAGGKVIYYTGYMTGNTTVGRLFNSRMYYPPFWIGMGD